MTLLYVVHAGQTDWGEQNRIDSPSGMPLSEAGAAWAHHLAEQLTERGIEAVFSSSNESDRQTAEIIAQVLGVKPQVNEDLHELDYGLWQGLSLEEIKRRHQKVYRLWQQSPTSVCPPGGETCAEAQERIGRAVDKILKRRADRPVLLVLHPLAAGLLKCRLSGAELSEIWEHVDWAGAWESYDLARLSREQEQQDE